MTTSPASWLHSYSGPSEVGCSLLGLHFSVTHLVSPFLALDLSFPSEK